MKKLLFVFALLSPGLALTQTPPPAPATAADVTAGTATYKFISPYALSVSGVASNGITAAGATNIVNGMRTQAGFDVGGNAATATWASTVGTIATNASPVHALSVLPRGAATATGKYGDGAIWLTNSTFVEIAPTGTRGVIRKLYCVDDVGVTGGLNTNLAKVYFQVFCDGVQTVNVPLASLSGVRYLSPTSDWLVNRPSYWIDSVSDSNPALARGQYLYTYGLKFPMPFTNGATARLTNYVDGSSWSHGYISAEVTKGLDTTFDQYRLYSFHTNRAQSSAVSNHIFTATGSGELLGVMVGVSNRNSANMIGFFDSQGLEFWLDNSFNWEVAGLDDFLGMTWGGFHGTEINQAYGATSFYYDWNDPNNVPGYREAYRWLYDDCIGFTNGFRASTYSTADNVDWTFFYLRKP